MLKVVEVGKGLPGVVLGRGGFSYSHLVPGSRKM